MRTTITLADDLLERARSYSGLSKTSELVDLAMRSYVTLEASKRLAALGGGDPFAEVAPRNRASKPTEYFPSRLAEPDLSED